MIISPVIVRELRAEARRPMNYWLRVMVGIFSLVLLAFALNQPFHPRQLGQKLFSSVNMGVFLSIWLFVPLLTADCIAREKREGTLGLLFLTPLTAAGIVIGKSLSNGLRALTVFVAVVPMLTLPFLIGGLIWKDWAMAMMLDSSALLLALASGILASSMAKDWGRACVLSLGFSLFFFLLLIALHWILFVNIALTNPPGWRFDWHYLLQAFWQSPVQYLSAFIKFSTGGSAPVWSTNRSFYVPAIWSDLWSSLPPPAQRAWFRLAGTFLAGSLTTVLLSIRIAAGRVKKTWRDEPLSRSQQWLLDTFCTPRFWKKNFAAKMTRALHRNPVGWLQQYSWSARLTKWGWCLAIVIIESLIVADPSLSNLLAAQFQLALLLLTGIAFTASGSFRDEHQSGALEILLTTPVTENQVIFGRLLGIWAQFFPAAFMLTLSWLFVSPIDFGWSYASPQQNEFTALTLFASSFLFMPVIGLYFSMHRLNLVAAWLATFVTSLGIPTLTAFLPAFFGDSRNWDDFIPLFIVIQFICAAAALLLLKRRLVTRRFAVP